MVDVYNIEYWRQYNLVDEESLNKYLELIKKYADGEIDINGYYEDHHIVPKSFDSSLINDRDNIVSVNARDHFRLHLMLVKCFEKKYKRKMSYALHMMCGSIKCHAYDITPEEYEECRIRFSESMSKENNPFYGKEHSEESRKLISDSRYKPENIESSINNLPKDVYAQNNGMFGKKHSYETRKLISDSKKGDKNPRYGKKVYTNGLINRCFGENDVIPDGFYLGCVKINWIKVHLGKRNKWIKDYKLDKYLSNGWEIGFFGEGEG